MPCISYGACIEPMLNIIATLLSLAIVMEKLLNYIFQNIVLLKCYLNLKRTQQVVHLPDDHEDIVQCAMYMGRHASPAQDCISIKKTKVMHDTKGWVSEHCDLSSIF